MSDKSGINIVESKMKNTVSLYDSRLTLIHPFFGEKKRFELLYKNWISYGDNIKDRLTITIVDDNGTPPIHSLMTPNVVKYCDFNLNIYRITEDLKYNTPGALNLGIMLADTEYVLIMDSDCTFSPEEIHKVMSIKPDYGWVYKFPRNRITENAQWKKNSRYLNCTMLMHKDIFIDINGFDEDFTGQYSGGYGFFDNHFDTKYLNKGYHLGILNWITATEWMDDVVGDRTARNDGHHNINKHLMYKKMANSSLENKHILRFPWERVFSHRRT